MNMYPGNAGLATGWIIHEFCYGTKDMGCELVEGIDSADSAIISYCRADVECISLHF